MRGTFGAVVVAAILVACGGSDAPQGGASDGVSLPPTGAPASGGGETIAYFEGTFDVDTGALSLVYRSPSGEIVPQSVGVTIPWKTSGTSGAYLHTRKASWTNGSPSTMNVGVSAENLYTMPINGFTAVVDSVTPPTVGLCNVVKTGNPIGNNCAAGMSAATWSCASGSGTKASPGIAPCRLSYGTIAHTGADPAGAGDVSSDNGVPLPWWFVDAAKVSFSMKGHVEGASLPTN